jgi:hypothetical protein
MRAVFGSRGMMTSLLLNPDGKTGNNRSTQPKRKRRAEMQACQI